jgi:anti-anti-sigma regulatory factor/HAMP domain-containing protein
MLLVLASVAIVSAGVTSLISYLTARQAVEHQAFEKLIAVREMKGNQIEDYVGQITDQILTLSESRMVVDAMNDLRSGFDEIDDELALDPGELEQRDRRLRLYYQDQFLSRLEEVSGVHRSVSDFWPTNRAARLMQELYITDNPFDPGSKHLLDAAEDGSSYSEAHRRYHPLIRNYLERFGYYDIFLVDHVSGDIVYAVFKEVDFGTSLLSGPYRGSNLAQAFLAARDAGAPGFTRLVDFAPYTPSYDAQASFIATPIHDGDEVVGILAFQMPVDRINTIMTSREEWGRVGLGDTGETYIVGRDLTLRNQSRFLIEDRESYLRSIEASGVGSSTVDRIATLGSTIGLQEVRTEGTLAAIGGETGTGMFPDYRGVPVLSAYRPLDIADVSWGIMSEIDRAEALAPVRSLRNRALTVLAILVVAILGIAAWFANTLTQPIKSLGRVAGELAEGRLDQALEVSGNDEISDLTRSFETMRRSLQSLVRQQEREIDALSVPLIPLRDAVMAMPLVGELDPRRLSKVRETLVEGLHGSEAKAVLLDLTGVPRLDEQSAAGMIGAARAARLLGVQVVLTGMQADVAKSLADLELHLDGIETARTLESGIRLALDGMRRDEGRYRVTEEEYEA